MAATELSRNYATQFCLFYIDNSNDIESLPTSKRSGKNELSLSTPCRTGSKARDMTGKQYVLNGYDEWVAFTTGSGSETGSDLDVDFDTQVATEGEVNSMLDDVFK